MGDGAWRGARAAPGHVQIWRILGADPARCQPAASLEFLTRQCAARSQTQPGCFYFARTEEQAQIPVSEFLSEQWNSRGS